MIDFLNLCLLEYFLLKPYEVLPHVRWVPFHHGMARPQVADGGKASRYGG